MADYKILDVNGHEMKAGEFFKFVPVFRKVKKNEYQKPENHKEGECKGSSNAYCGERYIFEYGLRPQQDTPYGDPVPGHFCAYTVVEDGVRGQSVTFKREAMRKDHFLTHDLEWVPDLEEKKPKAIRKRAAAAMDVWAKTSAEVKEKYLASEGDIERHEKAPGGLDGEWATLMGIEEFADKLKYMKFEYYLEDRSADEGELMDLAGFNNEEKAIDHLLEAGSKYGEWLLWKWDKAKKKWFQAKMKRKGKEIKIEWTAGGPG